MINPSLKTYSELQFQTKEIHSLNNIAVIQTTSEQVTEKTVSITMLNLYLWQTSSKLSRDPLHRTQTRPVQTAASSGLTRLYNLQPSTDSDSENSSRNNTLDTLSTWPAYPTLSQLPIPKSPWSLSIRRNLSVTIFNCSFSANTVLFSFPDKLKAQLV